MNEMTFRAVAIDGPAASGKSTVARLLAERLGLLMVNSGAMYRAVTWQVLQEKIDPADIEAVMNCLEKMELEGGAADGRSTIAVNGRVLVTELRETEVNAAVSHVATIPGVRDVLVELQRAYLEVTDVVMEGRDIGSVVFPDTPYKLYISASEKVRAQRRAAEGQTDSVASRDAQDSSRKTSPLIVAAGATQIDSSELTIEQTVNVAEKALRELGWEDIDENVKSEES